MKSPRAFDKLGRMNAVEMSDTLYGLMDSDGMVDINISVRQAVRKLEKCLAGVGKHTTPPSRMTRHWAKTLAKLKA